MIFDYNIVGQVSGKRSLEKRFEASFSLTDTPSYRVAKNEETTVIKYDRMKPHFIKMTYGLIPFWYSTLKLFYSAPIEGEITEGITTKNRMFLHPAFRRSIREKRCIVPADYYICYDEQENPYLVYLTSGHPFALGAIYDTWKQHIHDDSYTGFAIITMPAVTIMQKAGIRRMPLILYPNVVSKWLRDTTQLRDINSMMRQYPEKDINFFPLNAKAVSSGRNDKSILKPMGETIRGEHIDIEKILLEVKKRTRVFR